MRLAINLRTYVHGKIGGMENYVCNVLAGIGEHLRASQGQSTIFCHPEELEHIREFASDAKLLSVADENPEATINSELESTRYDLLFCPLLVLEPLRPRVASAVTIPDLQHEFFPEFFDPAILEWRRATFQPSTFYADVVFTISEYSRSTIVEKFGVDPSKVVVVGLDADTEFRNPPTQEAQNAFQSLDLPPKYIYFPANFWKHKNHVTLLRALKLLNERRHSDLTLVLTGAPSTGMDRVQSEAEALGLSSRVRFLGYQSRSVVAEIYRHSRALVFVTLFEGFGIPILEGFHSGIPIVTSKTTSCPEIAGDAAIFVDENDPVSVAAGIERLLDDGGLRRELVEKGSQRAAIYSWDQAIKTTVRTLENIATNWPRAYSVHVEDKPLVSIVTPTYNMGRFLEETIQSVLSQDYPHIDYVVMDGGSSDGTVEILRKYDGRLRYKSASDKGQADAINQGFSLTRGEVFAFLNADDTYLPGAVATATTELTKRLDLGVVYGDAYYVREDGTIISAYPTRPFDFDKLNSDCYICQPAAFMWRDAFIDAGGMNVELQTALDYDLWIRIAKLRPLKKINGYLATSRMYRDNKTLRQRERVYREILSVVKAHYGFVPYDWIYGYADYLLDRKDQILEATQPSWSKQLLALLLGSYVNRSQVPRYWRQWYERTGYGARFTGHWQDGWISSLYDDKVDISSNCERIVITGRHAAPFSSLELQVQLNGTPLHETILYQTGPFVIRVQCPETARGSVNQLTLKCSRSFRPLKRGDLRALSCIIDSISTEDAKAASQ